jgi:NADH-quinone oxidoreductase subunit N
MNPEILLLLWAIGLVIFEAFRAPGKDPRVLGWLSMTGVALVLIATWVFPPLEGLSWKNLYQTDGMSLFFHRLFLVVTYFVVWMSIDYSKRFPIARAEFFVFPLFTTVGMMLLASAADLVTIFVALELVTISFYVLVAYQRNRSESLEAATKYLIIGGLSTAFLVYGLAFLYGGLKTLSLAEIAAYLALNPINSLVMLGILLVVVGLAFKLAAVPFHVWAPDVYQGAPTPVTAFLATGSKAAGVVILIRMFTEYDAAFAGAAAKVLVQPLLGFLAIGSLLLGTFAALPQRNLKRLLGYSSIGHAGFILIGLSCYTDRGNAAVLMYLAVYLIAALLAFFIISQLSEVLGGDEIQHYAGLGQRSPLLAFGLAVAFVSMAGIPPLAGFLGKLGVLGAAWEVENSNLLIAGVVAGTVGLYYYLNIVRAMYWQEPSASAGPIRVEILIRMTVIFLTAGLIIFGFYPQPIARTVEDALRLHGPDSFLAETR